MTKEEKRVAFEIVENTLKLYLTNREYFSPPRELPALFQKNGASFVTINKKEDNSLRGCMGTIVAHKSLVDDLIHNTISSATGDPRFPPMTLDDIKDVKLEISILTDPKPLVFEGYQDLLDKIRIGVDGLIIKRGVNQATFLPSVWSQISSKEEFLMHLCSKAGMELECFKDISLEVFTYQTIKIEEDEL